MVSEFHMECDNRVIKSLSLIFICTGFFTALGEFLTDFYGRKPVFT